MLSMKSIICPNSSVWEGSGFSDCFSDLGVTVLGAGGNILSLVLLAVVGIVNRNGIARSRKERFRGTSIMHVLSVLQVCLLLSSMVLVMFKVWHGHGIFFYKQAFIISRFLVWATMLVLSLRNCWFPICCNNAVCCWWILRSFLQVPHLQNEMSSSEALSCFTESSTVLLEFIFGISINVVRLKYASSVSRVRNPEEDPLLSCESDIEEAYQRDLGDPKNYWRTLTFDIIQPVMEKGAIKQLGFEDLLPLPSEMNPLSCHNGLVTSWQALLANDLTNPSLFKAICSTYGWPYLRLGLLKVLNDSIGFAGPLLLNKMIRYLQQGSDSGAAVGFLLAVALGLTSFLKSVLDTQYTYRLSRLKLKLRSSIMSVVYRKCLSVSLAERSKFSEGEIQTFMSIDADRTANLCNSFHDIWSLPLQIGVALYLLYTQVKFAFVAGVAITILLIPVNKWISKLIASATEHMMKQKDERIRTTGELLAYIRTLKMYGWELLFMNRVLEIRSSEVKYLSKRKYLDAWCVFFWATTPTLFSVSTFGLFSILGHPLDAATVFTCLALFNTLISPLNSFPWVINGLIDAFISTKRLNRFLTCSKDRVIMEKLVDPTSQGYSGDQTHCNMEDKAISVHKAMLSWSCNSIEPREFHMEDLNLSLAKGSFLAIVGEVGSGKSSFLNAIIGEMKLYQGEVHATGSLAYVAQVPWILSGTIRDNILFGKPYCSKRYADILRACALDIDISLMAGGDSAFVGEKGNSLSGGQRARLALARAMYYGADIYLLDDVLSAVDSQVAHFLLHNAIHGPLMNQQTRVLCTHNYEAIMSADIVVVMDKGKIKLVGGPSELPNITYTLPLSASAEKVALPTQIQENDSNLPENMSETTYQEDCISICNEVEDIIEIEQRKEGKVELNVYRNYAAFSGWWVATLIFLSAILMQASKNGNDLWLSFWVDSTEGSGVKHPVSYYLVVMGVFCIFNSFLTLWRAFTFAFGGLRATIKVHDTLLDKLVHAPISFFDRTPCGRILNRFSSDLYTIDDSLPFILNILLANFVGLVGIAVVLSCVQVLFLLLLMPMGYIYRKLQFYYRSTSREIRRLDSVSRSPIYASFTETLDGSATIRAFNAEDFFFTKFIDLLAMYQRTSFSELTASLWLSLRLQLLAAFVITFIALLAVSGSHGHLAISFGTPGLVGLALSYAAPVVSLLGSFLTSFTETEKEMVAVERVMQYMDTPQEEIIGSQPASPDWPQEGKIVFQNATLRYLPSLPPALRDITFTISGGSQVGIIGRTGAGKSSIMNALFRLTPICGGSIAVDGTSIDCISACDLRSRLAIVPQTPFLFQGSVRDNLDPYHVSNDAKIWTALEKCHVKEEIEGAGGLDAQIKESGNSFSVGQRQLICLARAMLKSSKVLCLDECTANIDTRTASVIHDVLSTDCEGTTVITIAHRISTVVSMDYVLVLEQGMLVERGNPQALLKDQQSRFSAFARASKM